MAGTVVGVVRMAARFHRAFVVDLLRPGWILKWMLTLPKVEKLEVAWSLLPPLRGDHQ
jgi:hypothetical protein